MTKIFISYRREDSAGFAGRIYDRLTNAFSENCLFMDVATIEPGSNFDESIGSAVMSCNTMIVLIGKQWLSIADEKGRRLDNPNDFVRAEILIALNEGIRLIPVLLDGAKMPSSHELPDSISTLSRFQALEMRHASFDSDVQRLIDSIGGAANIFTGADDTIVNNPTPLPTAAAKDRSNQLVLLNKVETFWIKGVLEKSIHHADRLELVKETRPQAVNHPWEMVLELPDQTSQFLPSETKIIDIFNRMNRALLILGEPGSGKTITLLELARDLITRAEDDATQPIPVVFNLSSWTSRHNNLQDWMTVELSTKYQIPKKIGRSWLEDNRILPLLDGFDEVKPELRIACIDAINTFSESFGLSGSVVCSRLAIYFFTSSS